MKIEVIRSNKAPVVAALQDVVWPRIPLGIDAPTDPDGDELSITVIAIPTYGEIKDDDRTVAVGDELSLAALTSLELDPSTGAAGSFIYQVDDGQGGVVEATVHLRRPADDKLTATAALADQQVERSLSEKPSEEPIEPEPVAAASSEQPAPVEPVAAPSEEFEIALLETITGSNIRSGPDATAGWVASVPGGAQLKVVNKDEGVDWYEIETFEGTRGFISSRLVRPLDDQTETEEPTLSALEPTTASTDAFKPVAKPDDAPPKEVAALDVESPEKITDLGEFTECETCPVMIALPEGSFQMGSADGGSTEQPVRDVAVERPFAIGKYEVTVAQWKACAAAGACRDIGAPEPGDDKRPMQNVSWPDATAFANWLGKTTGESYRLPSEAEWEYAARGGKSTRFWWGDSLEETRVNCSECGDDWDRKRPSDIGAFEANPFGLHDMNGGVSEWTADCWIADYRGAPKDVSARSSSPNCPQRVLRGGSWRSSPDNVTSSSRFYYDAQVRYYTNGFRVVRDLPN